MMHNELHSYDMNNSRGGGRAQKSSLAKLCCQYLSMCACAWALHAASCDCVQCQSTQSSRSSTCHFFSIFRHLFSTLAKLLIKHILRTDGWVNFFAAHTLRSHVARNLLELRGSCLSSLFLRPLGMIEKFRLLCTADVWMQYTRRVLICSHSSILVLALEEPTLNPLFWRTLCLCFFVATKRNEFGFSWGTQWLWQHDMRTPKVNKLLRLMKYVFAYLVSRICLCRLSAPHHRQSESAETLMNFSSLWMVGAACRAR